MEVYKYANRAEYVAAQVEANKRKIKHRWVRRETIQRVAQLAPQGVEAVLCHGTRGGFEQEYFKEVFPKAYVIGTEISDTATQFPRTVQHDFHEPKDEWVGRFHIVYSNSFDHAMDPAKALETWRAQLAEGGRLFVELGIGETVNVMLPSDPLVLNDADMRGLLESAGMKVVQAFNASGINGAPEHASVVYVAEVAA